MKIEIERDLRFVRLPHLESIFACSKRVWSQGDTFQFSLPVKKAPLPNRIGVLSGLLDLILLYRWLQRANVLLRLVQSPVLALTLDWHPDSFSKHEKFFFTITKNQSRGVSGGESYETGRSWSLPRVLRGIPRYFTKSLRFRWRGRYKIVRNKSRVSWSKRSRSMSENSWRRSRRGSLYIARDIGIMSRSHHASRGYQSPDTFSSDTDTHVTGRDSWLVQVQVADRWCMPVDATTAYMAYLADRGGSDKRGEGTSYCF